MKREADQKAIGIWLECYNSLKGTDFRVDSYPDEHERNTASIDVLCKNSGGHTLGLEHTRVEAFPGEMTDNARFKEVLGKLEKEPDLAEVGIQTSASIEVGSIPVGISWSTLNADLAAFFRQHLFGLGIGRHTLEFVRGSVSITVMISKQRHIPDQPGSFLVARRWPGGSNEVTVKKVFEEKLPKLKAAQAERKILLLEQNSVASDVSSDVANYLASRGLPSWLPDEIWLLLTCVLETEQYMHVAQLHPEMYKCMAGWKNGHISMNYP